MNNMDKLVTIWSDWTKANNLPSMSASELLWQEGLDESQKRFINAFIEMWESLSAHTSSWDQKISPKKVQQVAGLFFILNLNNCSDFFLLAMKQVIK